jgi:hypothetical protein
VRDHKGAVGDDGPIRGYLCVTCNSGLAWLERVGPEACAAYLAASPIGPAYAAVRRTEQRSHRDAHRARSRPRA